MRYLIISDIHGSLTNLLNSFNAFNDFKCDKIIILGDILYHGPRNDLPLNYNPKGCIELLNNNLSNILFAVQGNCDAEVDQMVLNFNISRPSYLKLNDINFYLTHGHHLEDVPNDAKYVLYGHTHISGIIKENDKIFINPGSVSIPKGDKVNSFIILDNNIITIYDFNYNVKDRISL